ncbi:MAG: xylulokinase [bacterium]
MLLGIDIGTSGVKTIALSLEGKIAAQSSAGYPLLTPRPGWVEQNPDDWWSAVCQTVGNVVNKIDGGADAVRAISFSGHMSSVLVVDSDGLPLRPCLMLTDARAADYVSRLVDKVEEKVVNLTGNTIRVGGVPAKLLWIRDNEPDIYKRISTFLTAKDYIRLKFTGQAATEPTDAGNTLFLNPLTRAWETELYEEMGLEARHLPQLIETQDIAGFVTEEAASKTGLRPGIPVVAGGADMACSAIGTGCTEEGVVAVTIGTAAQVVTLTREIKPECIGRLSFHPHAIPGALYTMGSIFTGGLTLRWLAKAFGEENLLAADSSAYFDALSEQAAAAGVGSEGTLFLPFLVGSGSPEFDPVMRGAFLGLSLFTGKEQIVRAAMEGVAYNVRDSVEVILEAGLPVSAVNIGGGGSASQIWRDIMAGVLGRPIKPLGIRDVSALGAAVIAGVGVGIFPDFRQAVKSLVRCQAPALPKPGDIAQYDFNYRIYSKARALLGALYHYRTEMNAPDRR